MKKRFLAVVTALLTAVLLFTSPAQASEGDVQMQEVNKNTLQARNENPGFFSMTADLFLARPLLLVTTAVGTAIFIVSSPFSALGGNINQAADKLVLEPAKATFVRCLGCSYNEHPDL
ncbi:hypothetical protein GCM10023116_15770 [Kistimonas scapharcae]|uniref:Multidrug transporter n=1 Tax=Kistimonas scapharcae TaxID=1036133 RepID=A0ABP8UZD9_9GAMM